MIEPNHKCFSCRDKLCFSTSLFVCHLQLLALRSSLLSQSALLFNGRKGIPAVVAFGDKQLGSIEAALCIPWRQSCDQFQQSAESTASLEWQWCHDSQENNQRSLSPIAHSGMAMHRADSSASIYLVSNLTLQYVAAMGQSEPFLFSKMKKLKCGGIQTLIYLFDLFKRMQRGVQRQFEHSFIPL